MVRMRGGCRERLRVALGRWGACVAMLVEQRYESGSTACSEPLRACAATVRHAAQLASPRWCAIECAPWRFLSCSLCSRIHFACRRRFCMSIEDSAREDRRSRAPLAAVASSASSSLSWTMWMAWMMSAIPTLPRAIKTMSTMGTTPMTTRRSCGVPKQPAGRMRSTEMSPIHESQPM